MKKILKFVLLFLYISLNQADKFNENNSKIRKFFDFSNFISHVLDDIIHKNVIDNLDKDCLKQLRKWGDEFNKDWALTVIDSFGRKPSGILNGNTVWSGEYSQCIGIIEKDWNPKFCYISKKVKLIKYNSTNQSVFFKYGMCLPDKCVGNNLTEIIDYAIYKLDDNLLPFNKLEILNSTITCKQGPKTDAFSIVAIILTSVLVILVILATLVETYKILKSRSKADAIFKNETNNILFLKNKIMEEVEVVEERNFEDLELENDQTVSSISDSKKNYQTLKKDSVQIKDPREKTYTNTIKIFKVEQKADQFGCLHAIRVFSFFSVVLIHTWNHFTELNDLLNDNSFTYKNWKNNFLFSIVTNAYYCVDTFFLLSGLLCSYSFLKQINGKKLTLSFVLKFYLRRYYRITIPLILIMLFCVGLNKYFHTGPFYSEFYDFSQNGCPTAFWTHLLYINNVKNEALCFPHSWYLANDMQFYWLAPIIIIPFSLSNNLKYIGYGVSAILMIVHIVTNAVFTANFLPNNKYFNYQNIMGLYYSLESKPWCRLAPFVIGLLLGKLIYDKPKNEKMFNGKITTKILNTILWIISFLTLSIVIFGEHTTFVGYNPMNRVSQVLYITFSKILWSLALSFIIYSCINSYGGFINDFLSWSFWVPLSRLSFSAYLVHYSIVDTYIYLQDHPIHTQWSSFIYISTGNVFFAFCLAYVTSLLFEQPFMGLEKFIFKRD